VIERPRLGAHVSARRHLSESGSCVVLHEGSRALVLGEREWRVVRAMDGTRDLAGIAIAAASHGAHVRADHLAEFVASLDALGMLEGPEPGESSGEVASPFVSSFARDVPVRALPDYRFACDGAGECCRTYGSVLFTPLEVARACALVPELEAIGHDPARVFLPAAGLDETLRAPARRNGRCVFLEREDRCAIHARGGESAKPFGCRTFPASYTDVGHEIRVVPRLECSCVFEPRDESAPPISTVARGSDLARETFVRVVPESIAVGPEEVSRERFVELCDSISLGGDDLVLECLALADAVEAKGPEGRASSLSSDVSSLAPRIAAMRAAAEYLYDTQAGYHAPSDAVQRSTELVRDALRSLDGELELRPPMPEDERLVARAMLFGLRFDAPSFEEALRSCAARVLVARAIDRRAVRRPIAIVEAIARSL
jgi:lysine-N-methylase